MLMGSDLPDWRMPEAYYPCFDGQMRLNNDVNRLAVSGKRTSVADKDEKTIQVLGKPVTQSGYLREIYLRLDQEAISPKPTVCTLFSGQYLPCGIGVRPNRRWRLHLTSADIRRWELCASAIIEILKTTSPRDEYNIIDTAKIDDLKIFLQEHKIDGTFAMHIPNFLMDDDFLDFFGDELAISTGPILQYLLRFFIPLTAAYGGIHLSAWNFDFPSRVESITWRTACFVIIGSSFALLAVPSWKDLNWYLYGRWKVIRAFTRIIGYGSAGLLLLCYAASRLYLVVESFLSLRHVPIGVYAAVPWVQNIPHV